MKKIDFKELFDVSLEKDTRDNSDIYVYRFQDHVNYLDRADFVRIRETLKDCNAYYSRFKKGFISVQQLDFDNIVIKDVIIDTKKNNNNIRITYHKTLLEYITLEEMEQFYKDYAKEANRKLFYAWRCETPEELSNKMIENFKIMFDKGKESYSNKLRYIRDAIVWKSLELDKKDFRANGDELYYLAIWGQLPTVENLKMTDKAYSSTWGYDQTNVDVVYLLNKRFNGLNVAVDTRNREIYFTHLKNNVIKSKNGVKYFTEDKNPEKTFQRDASVTGQYR